MRLPAPLHRGVLLRRYKRFLADVRLDDGREVTAWCPNPGAMTGCGVPGWTVWLSAATDPKRKLQWTWELARSDAGAMILVHTGHPNAVAFEAVEAGRIPELRGYGRVRREVAYGEGSRVDLFLDEPEHVGLISPCLVEVKSVTLPVGDGMMAFPDAVTKRGRRHLGELRGEVERGHRAVQLFIASRDDARGVRPCDEVDPAYGQALREAAAAGVEVLAHGMRLSTEELVLGERLEVRL